MFKLVLFVTLYVLCIVSTQSDDGCKHSRSYTRVKRGKYPGPPIRFYSRPPMTFPIKGPFSYTPPPFMQDIEPPYLGSRPYKVSKRPINEGLGDDDINNLVKSLFKQDLNRILEFAYEKDKYFDKDVDYKYSRPHKRENSQRPTYTKDFYKGNFETKYEAEKPYEMEFKKYVNHMTEAPPIKYVPQDDRRSPYPIDTEHNLVNFYGPQDDGSTEFKSLGPQDNQPMQFKGFGSHPQDDRLTQFTGLVPQDSTLNQHIPVASQNDRPTQFTVYGPQDEQMPPAYVPDDHSTRQNFANLGESNTYTGSSNSYLPETNEEEKLPPPINMREEDFDVSYTNNVPTVVKADSDSYQVESFGDLPLMNYNSKLHSVSSYHVPHYTITQSKSQSLPSPTAPSASFGSSESYSSSSTILQPSPAAASIKAPPFEPAPPPSAAKEQSDAHLKATKIWSHKSKGVAYTLNDDGTLTPERPRPKYGYYG